MGVPFTAGQRVLAADLNTATQQGAWTSYTPTWTASPTPPVLGNGSLSGQYAKVGVIVTAQLFLSIGSTTTLGSGSWVFSLPFASSASALDAVGTWSARVSASGTCYTGIHRQVNGSSNVVLDIGGTGGSTASVDATHPFAWATGDVLIIQVTYRSAS